MRNIGKNIKLFRIAKNMTQDELAEKLFVTRQTISNYENNKSQPDIEVLTKLSEILEVDVNKLIYGKTFGEGEDEKLGAVSTAEKKYFIILTIVTAALVMFTVFSGRWIDVLRAHTYLVGLDAAHLLTLRPICYVMAGVWFANLMTVVFKIKVVKNKALSWTKRVAAATLIIYGIYAVPYSVAYILSFIDSYSIYFMNAEHESFTWGDKFFELMTPIHNIISYQIFNFISACGFAFILPGVILGIRTKER